MPANHTPQNTGSRSAKPMRQRAPDSAGDGRACPHHPRSPDNLNSRADGSTVGTEGRGGVSVPTSHEIEREAASDPALCTSPQSLPEPKRELRPVFGMRATRRQISSRNTNAGART